MTGNEDQQAHGGAGPIASSPPSSVSKCLSKRRAGYLAASGLLQPDTQVLGFIQQLDELKRKCELTGRYAEAGAAAARIADLKTAQATRLRAELVALQQAELEKLQETYRQETAAFDQQWRGSVAAFEASAAAQLAALKAAQQQQLAQFHSSQEARRPAKPQHSAQYLNHRKIEEVLVSQGSYSRAHQVKLAADALYASELGASHERHAAEAKIKKTQLLTKHQVELEVQLQRAARGRNELELQRLAQADKRHNRFRCKLQELDGMHRLEVVHLENYLDGQAQAGKLSEPPLRDSMFRRKRELLGL